MVHVASSCGPHATDHQDHVALAEIELCSELMIAASAVDDDARLSPARIDEVLKVDHGARVPPQGRHAGADRTR
ncbi:hypothetical protein [Streptomyces humicola]|uniref:hypothetical protein n=1 Tax=Streptomyces humicola TaxID=2953240 RepID=UPI0035571A25